MTSVKLTSNEGECISHEEQEVREWCIKNKKHINNDMIKSIISNEYSLDILLSSDREELKEICQDLNFKIKEKRKFIRAIELDENSRIYKQNTRFITINKSEQESMDKIKTILNNAQKLSQDISQQKDGKLFKNVKKKNLTFSSKIFFLFFFRINFFKIF